MAFADELTVSHVHNHAPRTGLSLTPLQSRGIQLSEAEIEHVVARTLSEARQIEARSALPAIATQAELSGQSGRIARRAAQQEEAAAARLDAVAAQYHPPQSIVEDLTGPRAGLPHVAPWVRRSVLALALAGVVWLWPWILVVTVVAALAVPPICAIALGSENVVGALARLYRWRHARHPEHAERMRACVNRFAMRMDAILDRLPEGWTTGLYMPDFSREALLPMEQPQLPDPFDRLRGGTRGA